MLGDSGPSVRLRSDLSRASGAAVAFLLWEWAITLDVEIEYIWSKPNGAWIKWAFLFTRYFSMAAQICNRFVDMAVALQIPMHPYALRAWYACQVLVAAVAVTGVEIVMMARVYALWDRKLWVGIIFIALIFTELLVVVLGVVITLPSSDFDPDYITARVPTSFAYFGIAAMVSQLTILLLSIMRYLKGHWGRSPIVTLMIRDGAIAFGVLSLFYTLMVVYTLMDLAYATAGYAWMLSVVSAAGCRFIINMQRLPVPDVTSQTNAPQLTTLMLTQLSDA